MTDRLSGCGCCCFNREIELSPDFYFPSYFCIVTENDVVQTETTPITVTSTYVDGELTSRTSVEGSTATVVTNPDREYTDKIAAAGTFVFTYPETSSTERGTSTTIGDRSTGNYKVERVDIRTTINLTRTTRRRLVLTFDVSEQTGMGIIDANGIPLITASHLRFIFKNWEHDDWNGTNPTELQFQIEGFLNHSAPAITTSMEFDAASAPNSHSTATPTTSPQYYDVTEWLPSSRQDTIRLLVDETRSPNRGVHFSEVKLGISEQFVVRTPTTSTVTIPPIASKTVRQSTTMTVRRVYSGDNNTDPDTSTLVTDSSENVVDYGPEFADDGFQCSRIIYNSPHLGQQNVITIESYDFVITTVEPRRFTIDTEFTYPFSITSTFESYIYDLRSLQGLPFNQTLVDVKMRVSSTGEPERNLTWPLDIRGPVQANSIPSDIPDIESLAASAPSRAHSFATANSPKASISEFDITSEVLSATSPMFFSVDSRAPYTRPDLSGDQSPLVPFSPNTGDALTDIDRINRIFSWFEIQNNATTCLGIVARIQTFPNRSTAYMDTEADWHQLLTRVSGSLYEFNKRLPRDRFEIDINFGSTRDYDSFWIDGARIDFSLIDDATLDQWLSFYAIVESFSEPGRDILGNTIIVDKLRLVLYTPNGSQVIGTSLDPWITRRMNISIYLRIFDDFVQFGDNYNYSIDVFKSSGRPRKLKMQVDFNSTTNDSRPQMTMAVREWADRHNQKKVKCRFDPWCSLVWPYTRLKGFAIEEVVNTTPYSFRGDSVTSLSEPCVPRVTRDPGQLFFEVDYPVFGGYAITQQVDDDTLYTASASFRIGAGLNYFVKPGEVFNSGDLVFIEPSTKLVTTQTNNGINGFIGPFGSLNLGGITVSLSGNLVVDMPGTGFSSSDVGSDAYADNQTMTLQSTGTTFIGKVVKYVSPTLLRVRLQPTAFLLDGRIGVSCFNNFQLYTFRAGNFFTRSVGRLQSLGGFVAFQQIVNIRDAGTAWATEPINFDLSQFNYTPPFPTRPFRNFLEALGGGQLSLRITYTPDPIYL